MSLLGKPINFKRSTHRDVRYRKIQSRIYNFLERPRGQVAIFYHVMVFFMVFACLVLSTFCTIDGYENDAMYVLFKMELIVVIWFVTEFSLRLWSSGCRSRYLGCVGRLKFLKRPFCIIDIVTILASIVVLSLGTSGQVFATSAIRGLRFFQILRMVRMDRRGGTWKLLGSVVYAHRQELITTIYIGFLGLIFSSFLVYVMERDVNKNFNNFAQALWWGVITLCTIGYGDIVPETWQGKLIGSLGALFGIAIFALPAGILGSGFALKVQQQQRQKHINRRHQPAATLIQSVWRCYAADEHSSSTATWKIHQASLTSPTVARASYYFKNNGSFVSRLPTIRRQRLQAQMSQPAPDLQLNGADNFDEEAVPRYTQLTNQHKTAIRFIRKMKYFVARRKFKEALKPYDVKDVMEQYAAGHVDLLGRVKNVQSRLDHILGKQGKSKEVNATCLASRVVKIERQVMDIDRKLDLFIKTYMEDRKRFTSDSPSTAAQLMKDYDQVQTEHSEVDATLGPHYSRSKRKRAESDQLALPTLVPKITTQLIDGDAKSMPEITFVNEIENFDADDLRGEGEETDEAWGLNDSDTERDNFYGGCDDTPPTEEAALLQNESHTAIIINSGSSLKSTHSLPNLDKPTSSDC